jgi:hypothetical protein
MEDFNNLDSLDFTPRRKLNFMRKETVTQVDVNYDYLIEQARSLNLDDVDFKSAEYDTIDTKIDKQKVYFWIRVYLSEEANIEAGDDIEIKYTHSGETLLTKFICFSKKGGNVVDYVDGEPVITSYNTEDDKKCLCLMVDEERINYDSEDIPIIRKLFRIGRHYDYVLLKRTDLILTDLRNEEKLEYYDIEF